MKGGTLQNACSTRPRVAAGFGKSALMHTVRLMNSRLERSKKNDDKSAVVLLQNDWHENVWELVVNHVKGHDRSGRPDQKRDHELKRGLTGSRSYNERQLGCVSQDMKPPKSILRKNTDMQRPIQRVKLTKAIARHTKIRDQNPSFGYIFPGEPHECSSKGPKFEDRSQEETEWQEKVAREKQRGSLPKAYFLKRSKKESTLELEEREFVVDSGASIHMISKKDLSDAEMDILTKSCSLTIVTTANGEVQTHEETTNGLCQRIGYIYS